MKKWIAAVVAMVTVFLLAMGALAAPASATLTGTDTVRAGDTITLTFNLNGSGIFGASGTLSYDSNQLTLKGTAQKIGSPWMVEFNGNNFVAYDNNLSNPINKNTALFTATFQVKSNLTPGTNVKVSCTGVTASDGNADSNIGTVTYSVNLAAPMSTDNTLKSLTVSNAQISPAFNSATTSYTANVPFEVSKLEVSAVANDAKAQVTVNSPKLTANGTTKVTVTVKAENGSTKTYTISVKRAQDPNYVPSGNNKLSGIKVDGFLLSPVFNTDTTKYVVWLPYETEKITVTGTAADKKADVKVEGGDKLVAGADNEIKVICTAENGTTKEYIVIAKRAAAHGSTPTEPTQPSEPSEPTVPSEPSEPTEPSQPTTEPTQGTEATEPDETEPTTPPTTPEPGEEEPKGVSTTVVIVVSLACLLAGVGIGFLLGKKLLYPGKH